MPTPSLKEFVETVPMLYQDSGLAAALEIFSHGKCDRLVVLSKQKYPIGIIRLSSLMPYLLKRTKPEGPIYSLIEPLAILPQHFTLRQFWPHLEAMTLLNTGSDRQLALVDADGKFIGMLNTWQLLKYIAGNKETGLGTTAVSLEDDLQSLIQLLEQLPLPLRLQTASGEVVAQNLTWRHQIGELQPDWLKYQTSELSEFIPKVSPGAFSINDPITQDFNQQNYCPIDKISQAIGSSFDSTLVLPTTGKAFAGNSTMLSPIEIKPIDSDRQQPANQETFSHTSAKLPTQPDRAWQFIKIPIQSSIFSSYQEELNLATQVEPIASYCIIGAPRSLRTYLQPAMSAARNKPYNSSIPKAGKQQVWLILGQDVTEQQQVAKELTAKNADLVQLNRFKDEFLACISHELKTPLTAVLGLSSLLKDQLLGQLNERQLRYAGLIYQSGRQLMTVVNDILDLTRMETGQMELTPDVVNIHSVCDRAYLDVLQRLAGKEKSNDECPIRTNFTLEIEPGLEMLVADEMRLRQMLTNLLDNAFKFTEVDGQIGLKVSRWDGWIAFTVWDSGIGIPESKQHLIFQKFQQLENPLTRRFEGTGLGLVLTQRLARLHGGDVSFISKVGQGSKFTLLLPPLPPIVSDEVGIAINDESISTSLTAQFSSSQCNRLVLVVEAVSQSIENVTEHLSSLGYLVVIARSGTEAIAKARKLQPVAILLNPLLPNLSGWDVLTILKSDVQTKNIPIVVSSLRTEKETAIANRADAFLSLPIQKEALLQTLTRLTKNIKSKNNNLTILYLTSNVSLSHEIESLLDIRANCQLLEADDLDQAELLVRVWQPAVILIDSHGLEDPIAYLKEIASRPILSSLPLITLDRTITASANQVKGLSVFPCLATTQENKNAALWQVIQVATRIVLSFEF